jgi:hypothetical protein
MRGPSCPRGAVQSAAYQNPAGFIKLSRIKKINAGKGRGNQNAAGFLPAQGIEAVSFFARGKKDTSG